MNITEARLVDLYHSLSTSGGFTEQLKGQRKRYAIAANNAQAYVAADVDFQGFVAAVHDVVNDNPDLQALGAWLNEGRLYLEPAETCATLETARALAVERQQIAFYDLQTGGEIQP